MTTARYQVQPATAERWDDLADLFGKHGAYHGCWCMWFRWSRQEFRDHRGDGNRQALEALVRDAGRDPGDGRPAPGLLAYDGDLAVGWCALAPRSEYPRLARSPVAKPVDDAPAWAVTCFYVRAGYRGKGVAKALLEAATAYAVGHGAEVVEGYPVDFGQRKWVTSEAYYGTSAMFERAGYTEVARRVPSRPFMRYHADQGERLRRLAAEVRALPVLDDRSPDEIIGYDERGLP